MDLIWRRYGHPDAEEFAVVSDWDYNLSDEGRTMVMTRNADGQITQRFELPGFLTWIGVIQELEIRAGRPTALAGY